MAIDLIPILLMVILVPGAYLLIITGQKRHIKPLALKLNGHFPLLSSTLIFSFKGQVFHLIRVPSGRYSSLNLWTVVSEDGPWVIGHKESKHYFYPPFWTLPIYEVEDGLVACEDQNKLDSLKTRFFLGRSIFTKKFQHLSLRSEWHIRNGFKKVNIMRYTGLSEDVNRGDDQIMIVLESISRIIQSHQESL